MFVFIQNLQALMMLVVLSLTEVYHLFSHQFTNSIYIFIRINHQNMPLSFVLYWYQYIEEETQCLMIFSCKAVTNTTVYIGINCCGGWVYSKHMGLPSSCELNASLWSSLCRSAKNMKGPWDSCEKAKANCYIEWWHPFFWINRNPFSQIINLFSRISTSFLGLNNLFPWLENYFLYLNNPFKLQSKWVYNL